jgi:uncharacterized protein YjiK
MLLRISILMSVVILGLIIILKSQNSQNDVSINNSFNDYTLPYNLQEPDKKYTLPGNLNEISGLCYYKKNKLLCIQDEKATIFIYDLKNKEVKDKYKFGKDGDFEGVEITDKKVYALQSDGDIFKVKDFKDKDLKKKKYETPLDLKNDCEGLCYDSISNSMLIACKGKPNIEKENKLQDFKAIYSFDMKEKKLNKTPFLLINLNQILDLNQLDNYEKLSQKLASELDDSGDIRFQPSGIAVHPITGNIYIIASVGQKLIVVNRNGEILAIEKLNKKTFRQPEGICFKPNGSLYISNEADGSKAKILKFKYRD